MPNKKKMMRRIVILLVCAVLSAFTFCACNGEKGREASTETTVKKPVATAKVEVVYLHKKKRCKTCMAIEQETRAVVLDELSEMVKQGKLRLRVVDISTEAGKAVAKKYGVTYSSLFVVASPGAHERAEDLTRFAFAKARSDAETFRKELKSKIMEGLQ